MKYDFASRKELLKFLNEELLSTNEAAEILDVSKVRIGHLVRDGKLEVVKKKPNLFLKSIVLEKKEELESLRKKYRPYDQ